MSAQNIFSINRKKLFLVLIVLFAVLVFAFPQTTSAASIATTGQSADGFLCSDSWTTPFMSTAITWATNQGVPGPDVLNMRNDIFSFFGAPGGPEGNIKTLSDSSGVLSWNLRQVQGIPGDGQRCQARITAATSFPPPLPPEITIDANGNNPETITEGASVIINWSVANNNSGSCSASGAWTGPKSVSGGSESQGSPSAGPYTYTLECTNSDGSDTKSVNVTVNSAPPELTVTPPSLAFGDVTVGDSLSAGFEFSVTNTGDGTLTGDISGPADPFTCLINCFPYSLSSTDPPRVVTIRFSPTGVGDDQTGTALFSCTSGCSNANQNRPVTGNGVALPPPLPTANFTSPLSVNLILGNSTNLVWTSTGADSNSCDITASVGPSYLGLATSDSLTVSPVSDTTYTLTCSNASGNSPSTPNVNVLIGTMLSATSPTTFDVGGSVSFDWSCSAGWDTAWLTRGPTLIHTALIGPFTDTPPSSGSYIYSLECIENTFFLETMWHGSVNVTVNAISALLPPIVTIDANGNDPETITEGESVIINWSVANNNSGSCSASGDWFGSKNPTVGSESQGSPSAGPYTYTLECTNSDGSDTKSVNVTVNSAPPELTVTPPSLAFGDVTVLSPSLLDFTVTNTGGGTLSGDALSAGLTTPEFECLSNCFYGPISVGAPWDVTIRFIPTDTISYSDTAIFSCTSGCSNADQSRDVTGNGVAGPPPTADSFDPPTATIAQGSTVTLTWTSTGADPDGCTIDDSTTGIPYTPLAEDGTLDVQPDSDTTYTLTCSNASGASNALTSVITVNPPPQITDFRATPDTFTAPGSSILDWDSTGATSCLGSGFNTGGATNGFVTVSPSVTTTYMLTCSGPGGPDHVLTVDVTVNEPLNVTLDPGDSSVVEGQSTILSWDGGGATSCTGFGFNTGGATSGNVQVTPVAPASTYRVTCTVPGDSDTAEVIITVKSPAISISVNPRIVIPDRTIVISWTTVDMDSCELLDPGGIGVASGINSSYTTPAITADGTYTLNCTALGELFSATVMVKIFSPRFEEI